MKDYHEPMELLDDHTRNCVRALNSLREEVEAVDWYHQRVAATNDKELKAVMAHNRDEEIEHVAMTLEWLRRNMDGWDEELRTYLFTDAPIVEVEEIAEAGEDSGSSSKGNDLGIGKLK
ncbi:MAG: encapsulin-associated ferritin-like protein [Senegalia sp. (in: firmicutes)]|uniref:encapsulin-associated ferritin-like protein n=1 Tax=Senegalia sp. (in: firmicutes) TaxID=1924098 RepID=UPI003F9A8BD3